MKRINIIVLGLIASLLLSCSNGDLSDVQRMLQTNSVPFVTSALPSVPTVDTFSYPLQGRDPFQSLWTTVTPANLQPDPDRPKEILEAIPLDSLRMVGTLVVDRVLWGLIRGPDGKVHRVTVGHHLGQNAGRIQQVAEDRLVVMEQLSDGLGGWQERSTILTVP